MNNCFICDKIIDDYVCTNCLENINIKEIIDKIIPIKELKNKYYILDQLINNLDSPYKELYEFKRSFNNKYVVEKSKREYLYNKIEYLLSSDITNEDKLSLKIANVTALLNDYNYDEAEREINKLNVNEIIDPKALYGIASYYITTRRYDVAKDIISKLYKFEKNEKTEKLIEDLELDLIKRINGKEYVPLGDENIIKYKEFIKSLGIEYKENIKISKQPPKIPVGEYPIPQELLEAGFKTFIAYDFETTGLDSAKDSLTEIGAIKVIDGEIIETKEFIFQELVHPYKKSIPKIVEEKTNITNEMVKDSRKVWEVFNDFADFCEDYILIGYNNIMFDRNFFVRAGRLSNRILTNKQFDVMKYQKRITKFKTDDNKLNTVANYFGIENPQAHRALADAITTAKLYLKLLEVDNKM